MWGIFSRPPGPTIQGFKPCEPLRFQKGDIQASVGITGEMGYLVREVSPDGAAWKAGVKVGDFIHSLNGNWLGCQANWYVPIFMAPPATTHKIALLRPQPNPTGLSSFTVYNMDIVSDVFVPVSDPEEPTLPPDLSAPTKKE